MHEMIDQLGDCELNARVDLFDGEQEACHQSKANRGGKFHYANKILPVIDCLHRGSMRHFKVFVKRAARARQTSNWHPSSSITSDGLDGAFRNRIQKSLAVAFG